MNRCEDGSESPQLYRYNNDRREQYDENHRVFDQRDHCWRPQPARVSIGSEYDKGDNQGNFDVYSHLRNGDGDAKHLEGNIRHGCYDAGNGY